MNSSTVNPSIDDDPNIHHKQREPDAKLYKQVVKYRLAVEALSFEWRKIPLKFLSFLAFNLLQSFTIRRPFPSSLLLPFTFFKAEESRLRQWVYLAKNQELLLWILFHMLEQKSKTKEGGLKKYVHEERNSNRSVPLGQSKNKD